MNERLQRIADDLGTRTYKDALHGRIAKDNFTYGVGQMQLEALEIVARVCDGWDAVYTRKSTASDEQARLQAVAQLAAVSSLREEIRETLLEEGL